MPDLVSLGFETSAWDWASSQQSGPTAVRELHPSVPFWPGAGFISAGWETPKVTDLRRQPRYILPAKEIEDASTRKMVIDAIDFAAYDATDPIFELDIERADSTTWENWATPQMSPVRKKWVAGF